jgi:hypothetical protein
MSEPLNREIHLRRRPAGLPAPEDFALVTTPVPQPGEGEVLVRNIFMSVDPYMRGRMRATRGYAASFELNEVMTGGAVGQVLISNGNRLQVGDYVNSMLGWRDYYTSNGDGLRKIDPATAPIQAYLGTFGMPGWSAYVGLLDIGRPKEGETVFVSAAAGAVGTVACQIARINGCRVIGSAGSDKKVRWLLDVLGLDAAFNYKTAENLSDELGKHAPGGVDIYFENVGGDHLEAALAHMNTYGRVVCCGMISQYNAASPAAAPRNLGLVISKRLTLKGFIISDHLDRLPSFYSDMGSWLSLGKIKWEETIIEGIENAVDAFIGLFKGENLGKMLVRLAPDPVI